MSNNFEQGAHEPTLFLLRNKAQQLVGIRSIHVDDQLMVFKPGDPLVAELKENLQKEL